MSTLPEKVIRVLAPFGTLASLLRNRDKVAAGNAGKLAANDLTVVTGRGIARQWTLVAGLPIHHGTVADEAAMLALHVDSSETPTPRLVVPGDSCLRADDPGWRWHCLTGHGLTLADWERRPLAGALEGIDVAGHTHTISDVTGLQTALDGKQPTLANAATIAKIGESSGLPTFDGAAWPGGSSGIRPMSFFGGGLSWSFSSGMRAVSAEGVCSVYVRFCQAAIPSTSYPTFLRLGAQAAWLRLNRLSGGTKGDFTVRFPDGNIRQMLSVSDIPLLDSCSHTLVATSDGSATGMVIYLDGTVIASGEPGYTGAADYEPAPVLIVGNGPSGTDGFVGTLATCRIWSGIAFTAAQVAQLLGGSDPVAPTWGLGRDLDSWPVDSVAGGRAAISALGSGVSL